MFNSLNAYDVELISQKAVLPFNAIRRSSHTYGVERL